MKIISKFKTWAKPLGGDHNPRDTFNDPRAGGKRRHNGIDMGAPANTEIYAVMDGTVDAVGYDGTAGNYVRINHAGGLMTSSVHMIRRTTFLKRGDKVKAGQLIGNVGNTGNSAANHLHMGLKRNGAWVNVYPYVMAAYDRVPLAWYEKSKGLRKGDHIQYLQELLTAQGYSAGNADGIFGEATDKAVRAFQSAKGLKVDGIVGAATWAKLTESETITPETKPEAQIDRLIKLMDGADVRAIQNALNKNGHKLVADGLFGTDSYRAVKEFQKSKGLTVDGKVGTATAKALEINAPSQVITLMQGEDVRAVQNALNAKGYSAGSADALYGTSTFNAVKALQKDKSIRVDGIVGQDTIKALGID